VNFPFDTMTSSPDRRKHQAGSTRRARKSVKREYLEEKEFGTTSSVLTGQRVTREPERGRTKRNTPPIGQLAPASTVSAESAVGNFGFLILDFGWQRQHNRIEESHDRDQ